MILREIYLQELVSFRDTKVIKVVTGIRRCGKSTLDAISDHNPKYLLTLDDDPPADYNGIKQVNALDWLLG